MKSEIEMQALLRAVESDERLEYEVALVQINAPLALEQVVLKTKADLLRWILDLPAKRHHGRDE